MKWGRPLLISDFLTGRIIQLAACTFLSFLVTVLLTHNLHYRHLGYHNEKPKFTSVQSNTIPFSMPFWKTAHQSITRNLTQRMARLIVFDFDGTATQQDTINVLAQFAISARSPSRSRQEASEKWKQIVDLYVADYAKHKESYVPRVDDRKTLAQELAYLESLRTVEVMSAERVVSAGFFAGLKKEQWEGFGRQASRNGEGRNPDWDGDEGKAVRVRKGFSEFVQQAKERGDKLGIVSVNWSRAFVEGVIEPEDPDRSEFVKRVNEVKWPGGQLEGPEEMGGKVMMTARDKLEGFETILLDEADGESKKRGSVYFGDSVTDLECLLRADTGIVVVNEGEEEKSKLLRTLQRLGFKVPHVSGSREGMKLAWARDFEEVLGSKVLG